MPTVKSLTKEKFGKARGYVVLDVEDPSGTLIYEEGFTGIDWEWEYPAK